MEQVKKTCGIVVFLSKLFMVCCIVYLVVSALVVPPQYGDFVLLRNAVKYLIFIAFGVLAVVMGITVKTIDSSVWRVAFVLFGFATIFMAVFYGGKVVKDIFSQETRQVVLKSCTYVTEESGGRYSHIEYYLCGESEGGKWKLEVTGIDTDILIELANKSGSARVTYYPYSHLVKRVETIE